MKEKKAEYPNEFWQLFLLFLGLKLGGVITWSWWWVTAPLWGWFTLAVLVALTSDN